MEWDVIVWCIIFPVVATYGSLLLALLLGKIDES